MKSAKKAAKKDEVDKYEDIVGYKVKFDFSKLIDLLKQNESAIKEHDETLKELREEVKTLKENNGELEKKIDLQNEGVDQAAVNY